MFIEERFPLPLRLFLCLVKEENVEMVKSINKRKFYERTFNEAHFI